MWAEQMFVSSRKLIPQAPGTLRLCARAPADRTPHPHSECLRRYLRSDGCLPPMLQNAGGRTWKSRPSVLPAYRDPSPTRLLSREFCRETSSLFSFGPSAYAAAIHSMSRLNATHSEIPKREHSGGSG